MSNFWKIYWLTRLDPISDLFEALIFMSILLMGFYLIGRLVFMHDFDFEESEKAKYNWIPKTFLIVGLTSGIFRVFIPTQNEAIAIVAGGATLNYAEKDSSLSKIPYQTTELVTKYLEKQIEKLEKEAK